MTDWHIDYNQDLVMDLSFHYKALKMFAITTRSHCVLQNPYSPNQLVLIKDEAIIEGVAQLDSINITVYTIFFKDQATNLAHYDAYCVCNITGSALATMMFRKQILSSFRSRYKDMENLIRKDLDKIEKCEELMEFIHPEVPPGIIGNLNNLICLEPFECCFV